MNTSQDIVFKKVQEKIAPEKIKNFQKSALRKKRKKVTLNWRGEKTIKSQETKG